MSNLASLYNMCFMFSLTDMLWASPGSSSSLNVSLLLCWRWWHTISKIYAWINALFFFFWDSAIESDQTIYKFTKACRALLGMSYSDTVMPSLSDTYTRCEKVIVISQESFLYRNQSFLVWWKLVMTLTKPYQMFHWQFAMCKNPVLHPTHAGMRYIQVAICPM